MPAPTAKDWVLTPRGDGTLWMSDEGGAVTTPTWDTITRKTAGPSYPYSLGLVTQWLNDPDAQIQTISVEDDNGDLVSGGVVEIIGGELIVNSNPGSGERVILVADTAVSSSAEADWTARSTGAGVVWAHDFRFQAEIDNFRWPNNPASTADAVRWCQTDGAASGKCLEILVPTGGQADDGWWRPFSALQSGTNGNGQTAADAADGGTITRRTDWNAGSLSYPGSAAVVSAWRGGMYTHNAYNPNFGGSSVIASGAPASEYDCSSGGTFYVQFRAKINAARWTAGNPPGKFAFISTTKKSNPSQELVIQSENIWVYDPGSDTNQFRMYTANGHEDVNSDASMIEGGSFQPGGFYAATCVQGGIPPGSNITSCWLWPRDQWVTFLIKVTPGRDDVSESTVTVWTDWNHDTNQRQNTYIKIRDYATHKLVYGGAETAAYPGDLPEGYNAFQASAFMNAGPSGANAVAGWYHRYTEIIFSRQTIACPHS